MCQQYKYLHTPEMGSNGHSFVVFTAKIQQRGSNRNISYGMHIAGILHLRHDGDCELITAQVPEHILADAKMKTAVLDALCIKCKVLTGGEDQLVESVDNSKLLRIRLAGYLPMSGFEELKELLFYSYKEIFDHLCDIEDAKPLQFT